MPAQGNVSCFLKAAVTRHEEQVAAQLQISLESAEANAALAESSEIAAEALRLKQEIFRHEKERNG